MATKQEKKGETAAPKPKTPRARAKTAAAPVEAAESQESRAPGAPEGAASSPASARRGRQQVKIGRVVSDKMHKTVVVAVENTVTHRLYHRYLKKTSKFAAHDEENRCKVGDEVEIVSSRPLSKTKRWRVREIVKRAE